MHVVITIVDDQYYALPTTNVLELLQCDLSSIRSLPGLEAPYSGVMTHREHVIPVIDGREMLGLTSFKAKLDEFAELLHQREQDHIEWLKELRSSCHTGREFTKATDPHNCAFGRWYDSLFEDPTKLYAYTSGDLTLDYLIGALDEPHRKIHGIAEHALGSARAGALADAEAIINGAWNEDLANLRQLFDQILREIRIRNRPVAVVTRLEAMTAAILVEAVDSILTVPDDRFQSVPFAHESGRKICGVSPDINGKTVMLFDLDQIQGSQANLVHSL